MKRDEIHQLCYLELMWRFFKFFKLPGLTNRSDIDWKLNNKISLAKDLLQIGFCYVQGLVEQLFNWRVSTGAKLNGSKSSTKMTMIGGLCHFMPVFHDDLISLIKGIRAYWYLGQKNKQTNKQMTIDCKVKHSFLVHMSRRKTENMLPAR